MESHKKHILKIYIINISFTKNLEKLVDITNEPIFIVIFREWNF